MESSVRIEPAGPALETPFLDGVGWTLEEAIQRPTPLETRSQFAAKLVECLPRLRWLATRLIGAGNDAEDLVQATALRALEKRGRFKEGPTGDLYCWVSRILRHLHCDQYRKRRPESLTACLDQLVSHEPAEIGMWRRVDDPEVDAAIGSLPEKLRQTYTLFASGKCYESIARALNIPPRTVGVRIHRARARLRRVLLRQMIGTEPRNGAR